MEMSYNVITNNSQRNAEVASQTCYHEAAPYDANPSKNQNLHLLKIIEEVFGHYSC